MATVPLCQLHVDIAVRALKWIWKKIAPLKPFDQFWWRSSLQIYYFFQIHVESALQLLYARLEIEMKCANHYY